MSIVHCKMDKQHESYDGANAMLTAMIGVESPKTASKRSINLVLLLLLQQPAQFINWYATINLYATIP